MLHPIIISKSTKALQLTYDRCGHQMLKEEEFPIYNDRSWSPLTTINLTILEVKEMKADFDEFNIVESYVNFSLLLVKYE